MSDNHTAPIRAILEERQIIISADAEHASIVAALPSAVRVPKSPAGTYAMPFNNESIALLHGIGTRASRELVTEAARLLEAQRYIEAQKQPGAAVPLQPIPVKDDVQLYNHQIKGYNIALALFGYGVGSWR